MMIIVFNQLSLSSPLTSLCFRSELRSEEDCWVYCWLSVGDSGVRPEKMRTESLTISTFSSVTDPSSGLLIVHIIHYTHTDRAIAFKGWIISYIACKAVLILAQRTKLYESESEAGRVEYECSMGDQTLTMFNMCLSIRLPDNIF